MLLRRLRTPPFAHVGAGTAPRKCEVAEYVAPPVAHCPFAPVGTGSAMGCRTVMEGDQTTIAESTCVGSGRSPRPAYQDLLVVQE